MSTDTQVAPSYMNRNGRWLRPLLAALVLLAGQMVASGIPEVALPDWIRSVSLGGALVGVSLCGFFAYLTDTLSAKIVWRGVLAVSVALAAYYLFALLF